MDIFAIRAYEKVAIKYQKIFFRPLENLSAIGHGGLFDYFISILLFLANRRKAL
jgi:hypothetical protein